MKDSFCYKKQPPFHQCCCECVFHIEDFHACTCNNHMEEPKKCYTHKGWACFPMFDQEGGELISGWPEHSVGCELHTDRKKVAVKVKLSKLKVGG